MVFLSRVVMAVYREGTFFSTSYFDSPNIPPITIPGLEAEKKKNDRALTDNHKKYTITGN